MCESKDILLTSSLIKSLRIVFLTCRLSKFVALITGAFLLQERRWWRDTEAGKFCVEYLIDLNATQAAIRAGYSKRTAEALASRLLRNVNIRSRIKELQDKVFEDGMMSAAEALWRLSKAGRGELKEEVVVTEGIGDGFSEAKIIKNKFLQETR